MARLSITQLTAQLEASHVSYEQLSIAHAALGVEAESLRGGLALAQHALAAHVTGKAVLPAKYLRHVPSPEAIAAHDAYARRLVAARELAIRGGITVRVS